MEQQPFCSRNRAWTGKDDNNTEDPIVPDRYKIYDKNIRSFKKIWNLHFYPSEIKT